MSAKAADAGADAGAIARFGDLLAEALAAGTLVKVVLSRHHGEPADLQRLDARPVVLRGAPALALTWHHTMRDVALNLAPAEAVERVRGLVGVDGFRSAHLLTAAHDAELRIGKRGSATLAVHAAERAAPAAPAHDRTKHRHVELTRPFLTALGVTTTQHALVPAMARKWKQIDKFVEVFSHAFDASPLAQRAAGEPVRVVDFGSGKGYLTFAVHDHLAHTRARAAQVTGIELRPDMVALGNAAAFALELQGLTFEQGDISRHGRPAPGSMDVMIALHACDTATDHALHQGIRAGASILLCSPCCHKEVRPQLLSPQPIRAILQHGIHLGQQAEMVTDGLRALLLEASGYDTQVFEFVALEHTSKNKMILAVKRQRAKPVDEVLAQIDEVKRFYGVREQALETLLFGAAPLPS